MFPLNVYPIIYRFADGKKSIYNKFIFGSPTFLEGTRGFSYVSSGDSLHNDIAGMFFFRRSFVGHHHDFIIIQCLAWAVGCGLIVLFGVVMLS